MTRGRLNTPQYRTDSRTTVTQPDISPSPLIHSPGCTTDHTVSNHQTHIRHSITRKLFIYFAPLRGACNFLSKDPLTFAPAFQSRGSFFLLFHFLAPPGFFFNGGGERALGKNRDFLFEMMSVLHLGFRKLPEQLLRFGIFHFFGNMAVQTI